MRVAVIGLGLMGSAASRRLRDAGFELILWNRSFEKAEMLARELNATLAKSVAEAVERAEIALLFLADDEAAISVAMSIPRADGLVVSNFSTITPRTSIQLSEFLKTRGVCYLETPVIGGPGVIREGKAIVLLAGPRYCSRRARGVLEALASDIVEISEDVGKASALKLAFNLLLINTIASLAEALSLAEAYEVDRSIVVEVLSKSMFREIVERYYNRMVSEEAPVGFKLSLAAKDLEYALRAGYEKRLPLPVTASTQQLYRLALRAGLGEADYTKIYKFIREINKLITRTRT